MPRGCQLQSRAHVCSSGAAGGAGAARAADVSDGTGHPAWPGRLCGCLGAPSRPSAQVKRGVLPRAGGLLLWGASRSGTHLPAGMVALAPRSHGCPSSPLPCPSLQNGLRNSEFQLHDSLEPKSALFRISMEIFSHLQLWKCTRMGLQVPLLSCRATPARRRGRHSREPRKGFRW